MNPPGIRDSTTRTSASATRTSTGTGDGDGDSTGTGTGTGTGTEPELTGEELQVLRLAADGLTVRAVARHTGLSSRTVCRRTRSACDRLGVATLIQAVACAARRGLI